MITAPFNFVPLSEKVFFPDWSEKVSHDVPFEDAQSGIIDITITAESPIFIKNHSSDRTKQSEDFCNHNGEYYIPGSSVKGMVRNVLEIMSFSKMTNLNDDTYAVRDLSDSNNFYMKEMKKDTYCGWLSKTVDGYVVEDCGKPGRIKHEEIDKVFSIDFASKFKKGTFGNKADNKTALKKYELIASDNFTYPLKHTTTSTTNEKRYALDTTSSLEGTIVLTGQPSGRDENRKIPNGKVYEFVFFDIKGEIKVSNDVMKSFLFAYFDGRKTEPKESPDWKYWKEKLNNGEKVPVFFQKNGKDVAHFGLSYLYNWPYIHSVKDGLPPTHSENRKDLAETMFGYIGKEEALKGRVQFSHFKTTEKAIILPRRTEILGTPRASYYPMYVKQYDGKLFKTFMDGDFSISGWKRYPVHSGSEVKKTTDTGNENVGTTFSPLKEGVIFKGKARYHNLRKAELGALLSALTFHDTKKCYHNIGMAKALGYGKISMSLSGIEDLAMYLKAFETEASEQIEGWSESEQILELLTMATEQSNTGNASLKYMDLPQFSKNKTGGDKDYLRSYSALQGISVVVPKSLISEEDVEALRVRQAERKEFEKVRLEKKKREEAHKKEWEIVYASTNLSTIEAFVVKYPGSRYLKTANEKIAELKSKAQNEADEAKEQIAKEKWVAIQKVDEKYKYKALEDFVLNYGYSQLVVDARKELASLQSSTETVTKSIDELASASDGKRFKNILEELSLSEDDKYTVKKYALETCQKLKGKKLKNFFKDAQLGRFIGKDLENEIKKEV